MNIHSDNGDQSINGASIGDTVKFGRNPVGIIIRLNGPVFVIKTKKGYVNVHSSHTQSKSFLTCKKVLVEKISNFT